MTDKSPLGQADQNRSYTYSEVFDASKEYFNGDELAAKVFVDKYALQNNTNQYLELTPADMHHRLAKEFARVESWYPNPLKEEEIFSLLDHFKYVIPQGSPMYGIGNPYTLQSLGNCFVIESPMDSYGGIFKADQELAQLMKRRAGVGLDISNIRPKGEKTSNAAKTTDGIGVFMERFSNTCREVAQSGRRGAEMQSISIEHPEVETFIDIKKDTKKVTGANISVRVTDEFMEAVREDKDFTLRWPVGSSDPKITKKVKAKLLWSKIIQNAWASAEPGVLFWSNVEKYSPADIYGQKDPSWKSQSTNPCGEIPMGIDSCRLMVVNLLSFVKNPFQANAEFDFEQYGQVVVQAQRLMDDLIDLEAESIQRIIAKIESDPENEAIKAVELSLWRRFLQTCLEGRRTGLGITALGDTLAALNITYGSENSIEMTDKIYQALAVNAYKSSCILAEERGAFPIFDRELEKGHPFLQRIWEASPEVYELYQKNGRRNIALTTTAPTGSVSTMTQTTSGIEPVFLLSYVRRKKINPQDENVRVDFVDPLGDSWQEFTVYHHGLKNWMNITGETDITKSPYHKSTSADCDWRSSVKLQGAAQKWICHAISKTVNIPNDTSVDVVKDIYMMGWEAGLKGLTIYRDGCRTGVLVSESDKSKKIDPSGRPTQITRVMAPKRPKELSCDIHHITVKGIKWTAFVGLLFGEPYELFMGKSEDFPVAHKYKHGKIVKTSKGKYNLYVDGETSPVIDNIVQTLDDNEIAWATRMISTSLRHGIGVEYLVEQLSKEGSVVDINNAIARILRKYLKETQKKDQCPSCGGTDLVYEEKCKRCLNSECGWSGCN